MLLQEKQSDIYRYKDEQKISSSDIIDFALYHILHAGHIQVVFHFSAFLVFSDCIFFYFIIFFLIYSVEPPNVHKTGITISFIGGSWKLHFVGFL